MGHVPQVPVCSVPAVVFVEESTIVLGAVELIVVSSLLVVTDSCVDLSFDSFIFEPILAEDSGIDVGFSS